MAVVIATNCGGVIIAFGLPACPLSLMFFDRLLKRQPRWPADVPRLYPTLDDRELCSFLTREEHARISKLPMVAVLPFFARQTSAGDMAFGAALSRLVLRDLMLVREISVRGPEDTPRCGREDACALHGTEDKRTTWITGTASASAGKFTADLTLLPPGNTRQEVLRIEGSELSPFVAKCAAAIAKRLGGAVKAEISEMWRHGRPTSLFELSRLGQLLQLDQGVPKASRVAVEVLAKNPALGIACDFIEGDHVPNYRTLLLESVRHDPYYAQNYFSLFCAVWDSTGPAPHAVQFLRRAIELSPGHGKAHMCAPHAATPGVNMLPHSDLGYRLLPGNPFAISNYITNLLQAGKPIAQVLPLAYQGIEADPCDPGNYYRLMGMLEEIGEYQSAIEVALSLLKLYEPEMNDRAWYCLQQNPRMKQRLLSGKFDPAESLHSEIRRLQERL
jgi:hypothetical protein